MNNYFLNISVTYFLALPYRILHFSAIQTSQLEFELKQLRSRALAKSSLRTHKYQWESFKQLCASVGRKFFPASVNTVFFFIAHLARNLEHTTILNYTSSIVSLHHYNYCAAPDLNHFLIKQALAGLKRFRHELPHQRKPICPSDLRKMFVSLPVIELAVRDPFWAACWVTFFSLARSADFFRSSTRSAKYSRVCDVCFDKSGVTISLPILENNRFKGKRINIFLKQITH